MPSRLVVTRARREVAFVLLSAVFVLAACGSSAPAASSGSNSNSKAKSGGSLTVYEVASQWPGLDPATNTQDAADYDYENAIFGELFEQGPGTTVIDDLASGYHFADHNLELVIDIRKGVTFSDGTPYTAADVVSSIKRDLTPSYGCLCDSDFAVVTSITSSGDAVTMHLSHPSATLIDSFVEQAPDWTIDPSALASMGESAYAQRPVGAGPFEVVSNTASSSLVLKKNPHYWQKGRPYLDKLTFTSVSDETTGLNGIEAHSGQAMVGLITATTINQAKSNGLAVPQIPGDLALDIQLNSKVAPFNNLKAREALSYATNPKALLSVLNAGDGAVVECPCGPESIGYEAKVPGYHTYDLAKAKTLVHDLGGLSTNLMVLNTPQGVQSGEAIATQWEAAGVKVKIVEDSLQSVIQAYTSNSWTATTEAGGGIDPDVGVQALPTRETCSGIFSGTCSSTLDNLITKSTETLSSGARVSAIHQVFADIAQQAYTIFMYSAPQWAIAAKDVGGMSSSDLGPGQEDPVVNWENVYVS